MCRGSGTLLLFLQNTDGFLHRRLKIFTGELVFQDVLEMEHIHVIYWLKTVSSKAQRGRQVLSVPIARLEKYLILLDALHVNDKLALLYRLNPIRAAKMFVRQYESEHETFLKGIDRGT